MAIKIGEQSLTTRKPKDAEAELLASTGCSPAEVVHLLSGNPTAHFVARALAPHLTDGASTAEVAALIAASPDGVIEQVRKLYGEVEPQAPSPVPGPAVEAPGDTGEAGA